MLDTSLSLRLLRDGLALMNAGRIDQAEALIRRAMQADPLNHHALLGLSWVGMRREDPALARWAVRRALMLAPEGFEGWANLANNLQASNDWETAVTCYRRAMVCRPDAANNYYNQANNLTKLEWSEAARRAFQRVLLLDPMHPEALTNLSFLLVQLALKREARQWITRALSVEPLNAGMLSALARLHKASEGDRVVDRMRTILTRPDIDIPLRRHVNFALARLLIDMKRYSEAFPHLLAGHKARALDLGHDPHRNLEIVTANTDQMMALFGRRFFETLEPLPEPRRSCPRPIFVVGMPRSGTSLTEQILASHPLVHGAGELSGIAVIRYHVVGHGEMSDFSRGRTALTRDLRLTCRKAYLDLLATTTQNKRHVVDKMPTNFINVWLIRVLFPDAPIIHCTRDPLDTCYSNFTNDFSKGHPFIDDLEVLGKFYRNYVRLMDHWSAVLPVPPVDFQNEALVADPEPQIRRLLDACGLPFDPACLKFADNKARAVKTASALQVRDGLNAGSIGKWRQHEKELEPLRRALGDLAPPA